jgi:hypothetical protein
VSAPLEPWCDDIADLLAMVEVGRLDDTEPGWQEAFRAISVNCDKTGVLAAAVKLLAELAGDLDFCPGCFRDYAARAIARTPT